MEQQPFTPINGTNIDPNTFRRVWDRVMPDQSGSPLAVDIPAAEDVLEPVASSTQLPPVPTCPAAGQNLPPVPVCPVEPAEPEPPVQPAPPAQPEPSEPVQPSQPEDAPLCLGEQSRPYTQRLEELMALAQTGIAAGQLLCRRVLRESPGRADGGPPPGLQAAVRRLLPHHRRALPPRLRGGLPPRVPAPGPAGAVRPGAAVGAGLPPGRPGDGGPLSGAALPGAGPGRRAPHRCDPLPAGADVRLP